MDMKLLRTWVGRQEVRVDEVIQTPVKAMMATLDLSPPQSLAGFALPPLWHWLYFLSSTASADLAADGHARKGGFLPPVPLSRRMWAGGCVEFIAPICVGDAIRRVSTIADIQHKVGTSGELVFVTVNHDIYAGEQLLIHERQDLVYREAPRADAPPPRQMPPPEPAQWSKSIDPTPALLFRYSALTFNAHRIHYDRDYAVEVDGYSDLVVHGPLVATLLAGLIGDHQPGAEIERFEYRGVRPLLAGARFELAAKVADQRDGGKAGGRDQREIQLWAKDAVGWLTMNAQAIIKK